jgi:NAD+ synthase (glutamine-hydrolysing)
VKIALVQNNYHIGNFSDNSSKIIQSINKAQAAGADLVVFSELSVCGYYPHDMLERSEFIEKTQIAVENIASQCLNIAAIVGAPTVNYSRRGKRLYNSALFIRNGVVEKTIHKTLLPTYDIFDEYRHFEPNRNFDVIELKGEKIALTICEDLWDNQPSNNSFAKSELYITSPLEELSKFNPYCIINIAASPFSNDQEDSRKTVLKNNACKYSVPLVYVNQVGAQTEIVFDGGSMVIDAKGEIIHELKYFTEDFRIVDLADLNQKNIQPGVTPIKKIYDALVLGISDYFGKCGFWSATLGLSGGIDSAVVAVLAVRALGPQNVRVLLMPSKYSSKHSVDDAVALAQNLGIEYQTIPIQKIVDEFEYGLSPVFGDLPPDVSEENIQARARGVLLMALSNKFGNILLNTSNKSECAVGYGTLYGDMNGGLSVLADVYKTDVFNLAHFINQKSEIIPNNTIIKPPSAELRPDQKDSDSLPDYAVLDKILYAYIEQNKSPNEIIKQGFDSEIVFKTIRLVNYNEYKRFQTPPILRVSSKAFGFGRKMPLVAQY